MKENKWQALPMKDRAFFIKLGVQNGINDLGEIKRIYEDTDILGTPYRTFEAGSDYDYFNAHPENMPNNTDSHWTSRNPKTGQLLKSPNHPTYDLLVDGEKSQGYKIIKIGDREYSIPNSSHRYSGEKDNNLSKEEFFKQKQAEAIQAARDKQAARTTYLSPIQAKTEDDIILDQNAIKYVLENKQKLLKEIFPSYSSAITEPPRSLHKAFGHFRANRRNYPPFKEKLEPSLQERMEELDQRLHRVYAEAEKCTKEGYGCIYQSMDNYGKEETNNVTFMQDPSKYGFRTIPVDSIKPGDVVQFTDEGVPYHMMMAETPFNNTNEEYEGQHMRYSGNQGHELRQNTRYPYTWKDLRAYTFVGDAADSVKWNNEYEKLHNTHSFSGEEDTGILDNILNIFKRNETPKDTRKTVGPVDLDEIRIRQAWAESRYDDNAKSRAGARGRFQIMPAVQADYIKAGGKKGNLHNAKYNTQVRDWYMDNLSGRPWITKGNATDSVRMGKQLAAYNAGPTKVLNALQKAKNDGVDIYDSFDWVSTKYLKPETVDYVNWILRNKTTGSHRNDTVYQENKHKYKK